MNVSPKSAFVDEVLFVSVWNRVLIEENVRGKVICAIL